MGKERPNLPPTRAARAILLLGVLSLLVSLWAQARMWAVEFGLLRVAAGGGEYLVAILFALPLLLIALLLFGISVAREAWVSRCAWLALALALVPACGFVVVFLRDAF